MDVYVKWSIGDTMISLRKLFQQSFEGHKGRPGKRGGSLPKGGGTAKQVKPQKKTIVTDGNMSEVATEVINAAQAKFGDSLLDASESKWKKTINPWMDNYIKEHYSVYDDQMSDLNDMIGIELENNEIGTHF